jgi:hypothetical protein
VFDQSSRNGPGSPLAIERPNRAARTKRALKIHLLHEAHGSM